MEKKPTYSVDDILLEYELNKKTASDRPKAKPSAKERFAKTPTPAAVTPKKPVEKKAVKLHPGVPVEPPVRTVPADDDVRVYRAAKTPLKKADEDTRPIPPIRKVQPLPATEKTVAVNTRTRVLTVAQSEDKQHTQELPLPDQLEGQLVMENFVPEPVDEKRLEEELRRRRQEKVNGFRLVEGGKAAFKLTGEEEESDTEEELVPEQIEEEDTLEDFNDYAEAEAIRSELAYRLRMGAFALIATAALTVLLTAVTLLYSFGLLSIFSSAVLTALHTVLLGGVLAVNYRLIGDGWKGLLKMRADADAPAAVVGTIGMVYTLAQFAAIHEVDAGSALFLSAPAALAVLAGALGRHMQILRIRRNFGFISNEKVKKMAAMFIDDEKAASEIGRPADIDGIPPIVYYRKASFVTHFLENSYARDPADRVMRWFVPLALGVSLLCAVGYGLLFPDYAWKAPTVFAASAMLTLPVWTMYVAQRAAARSCKKTLKNSAMISGYAAAEQFDNRTKAVILDAGEIFPKKQVKLHGIKTFSGTRIDEAITDAAAVVIAAGGPLAPIFQRLIENRTDILREVDSLAYEQDMGLSGWVGGRRVLIGNRRLLENHGVDVPPKDYEERYTKDGRETVYLSTGGELSAMFVVSYLADETIKAQLRKLHKQGVDVLVRTCDPNITSTLVCDVMELPTRAVEVLSASEGRAYESLLKKEQNERAQTTLVCSHRAVSKMTGLLQCRYLRRGLWVGLLSQVVCGILGMAFAVFISATTGLVLRAEGLLCVMLLCGILGRLLSRCMRS